MTVPTALSLFSGGGLADVGLQAAGYTLVGAVEHDPAVAEVYRANLGDHVVVGDVAAVNPARFDRPDLLWASPPCQAHSVARARSLPTRGDAEIGRDVLRWVGVLQPRVVVIENVPPYAASAAARALVAGLFAAGYWVTAGTVNSADVGVPQTRVRYLIRAVRGGLVPPLPARVPWVGWYAAIADLIDTLPASQFAPWQLKRLLDAPITQLIGGGNTSDASLTSTWHSSGRPAALPAFTVATSDVARAFLMRDDNAGQEWGKGYRAGVEPAFTMSQSTGAPKAFLMPGANDCRAQPADTPCVTVTGNGDRMRAFLLSGHSDLAVREPDQPMVTVTATDHTNTVHRAFLIDGQESNPRDRDCPAVTVAASAHKRAARAWLEEGRVVRMTPRALARFQSVPDWYTLPDKAELACRVIGNGVPCLLAQALGAAFLRAVIQEY